MVNGRKMNIFTNINMECCPILSMPLVIFVSTG